MIFYHKKNLVPFFRNATKFHALNIDSPTPAMGQLQISVCTVCMNRLRDLRHTLPRNLEDSKNYKPAEFILLDYGSSDGLEEWVTSELRPYLDSGRLKAFRTESSYFRPNHSRNITFRLASGDLVANVDSDNFMHRGYLQRLNQCASVASEKLLIVPDSFLRPDSDRVLLKGRFALYRKDIEALRGFDERLDGGFGFDDLNFIFRAMLERFKIVRFESRYTEGRIPTSDEDRNLLIEADDFEAGKAQNERLTEMMLATGKNVNPAGWGKANLRRII
jgi:glycosyltransferase involved in cell wall biosynthesis